MRTIHSMHPVPYRYYEWYPVLVQLYYECNSTVVHRYSCTSRDRARAGAAAGAWACGRILLVVEPTLVLLVSIRGRVSLCQPQYLTQQPARRQALRRISADLTRLAVSRLNFDAPLEPQLLLQLARTQQET